MTGEIICGDCIDVMAKMPADSVDLIVTSPPYADRRKEQYGGIPASAYIEWFMPRVAEMNRLLKQNGSLVINIKEHVVDGERSEYVLDIIKSMRQHGWKWIDDYIWRKTNPMPGKWPSRLKDTWEHCLHFSPTVKPVLYHDQVLGPAKPETIARYGRAKKGNVLGSGTKSGFTGVENIMRRVKISDAKAKSEPNNKRGGFVITKSLPGNMLHFPSESRNRMHPAAFPEDIPEFFINLFTKPSDMVLDPFCGSGTTCAVAAKIGRKYIGIEISREYCDNARVRADVSQVMLEAAK